MMKSGQRKEKPIGFTAEEVHRRFVDELDKQLSPPYAIEGRIYSADYIKALLENIAHRVAYEFAYEEHRRRMEEEL
jgi:hypothetical protein